MVSSSDTPSLLPPLRKKREKPTPVRLFDSAVKSSSGAEAVRASSPAAESPGEPCVHAAHTDYRPG